MPLTSRHFREPYACGTILRTASPYIVVRINFASTLSAISGVMHSWSICSHDSYIPLFFLLLCHQQSDAIAISFDYYLHRRSQANTGKLCNLCNFACISICLTHCCISFISCVCVCVSNLPIHNVYNLMYMSLASHLHKICCTCRCVWCYPTLFWLSCTCLRVLY